MFGSKPSAETPSSSETAVSSNGKEDANTSIKNGSSKTSSKYMVHLKALNETVTKWIKDHVDKNPYILLTPVFEDYKTHLAELERKYGTKNESSGSENAAASEGDKEKKTPEKEKGTDTVSSSEKPPGFSFSTFSSNASVPKTTSTPAFSFGGTTTTVSSSDEKKATSGFAGFGSTGGFSFGKPEGSATSGFSFGSTAAGTGAFSFATSKPSNSGDAKADEEEEYVPPKPESSNITEEDAFYNKRVKLFFKQDGDWKDRGVGLLFLKPCDDKTQLLIRADTSIGNILLNIMLNKSMPVSRTGKNNVMTMCIPNPPLDEKKPDENTAVGMLLRVKTTEDADELAEKLKEYKDK
jgi:nuclear pore complex protein Nup50